MPFRRSGPGKKFEQRYRLASSCLLCKQVAQHVCMVPTARGCKCLPDWPCPLVLQGFLEHQGLARTLLTLPRGSAREKRPLGPGERPKRNEKNRGDHQTVQ